MEDILTTLGLDLDVDVEGGHIGLARGSCQQRYQPVFAQPPKLGRLVDAKLEARLPLLVMSSHVSRRLAEELIRADIQFVDHSGNAFIHFDDVMIRILGTPKERQAEEPIEHQTVSANLLSPRRAQVVLALLEWPELATAPLRELGRAAGVSVGTAHEAVRLLSGVGHVHDGVFNQRSRPQLLDLWAAAYPNGLGAKLGLTRLGGEAQLGPLSRGQDAEISGEAACADLVNPQTLTVYVPRLDPHMVASSGWRKDRLPHNIIIRRRFWTRPSGDGVAAGSPRLAPWPIVYADLLASQEPRQLEAAAELRAAHV